MSFWNSRKLKARKEHKCEYCGKGIAIGETYWRETGTFDNDFNDYCLDKVCKMVLLATSENGNELGTLWDDIDELDIVKCPDCKSSYFHWKRTEPFTHKYHCECGKCKTEWDIELTEELIKGGAS